MGYTGLGKNEYTLKETFTVSQEIVMCTELKFPVLITQMLYNTHVNYFIAGSRVHPDGIHELTKCPSVHFIRIHLFVQYRGVYSSRIGNFIHNSSVHQLPIHHSFTGEMYSFTTHPFSFNSLVYTSVLQISSPFKDVKRLHDLFVKYSMHEINTLVLKVMYNKILAFKRKNLHFNTH